MPSGRCERFPVSPTSLSVPKAARSGEGKTGTTNRPRSLGDWRSLETGHGALRTRTSQLRTICVRGPSCPACGANSALPADYRPSAPKAARNGGGWDETKHPPYIHTTVHHGVHRCRCKRYRVSSEFIGPRGNVLGVAWAVLAAVPLVLMPPEPPPAQAQ